MTRVVLTDAAKQDLLDVWLYIAADNLGLKGSHPFTST